MTERVFRQMMAALVVLLLFWGMFACSARATGGYYDDNGFYTAGTADPCAEHGGSTGPPTTGIDPATGRWFDEFSCADGTKVRVDRGVTPGAEEANYEPTPSDPPPPCVEAHYTDDGWEEGSC